MNKFVIILLITINSIFAQFNLNIIIEPDETVTFRDAKGKDIPDSILTSKIYNFNVTNRSKETCHVSIVFGNSTFFTQPLIVRSKSTQHKTFKGDEAEKISHAKEIDVSVFKESELTNPLNSIKVLIGNDDQKTAGEISGESGVTEKPAPGSIISHVEPVGIALYDALVLRNYTFYDNSSIGKILKFYEPAGIKIPDPFIPDSIVEYGSKIQVAALNISPLSNLFGIVGNAGVTTISEGLVKLIIKRTNEALTTSFFNKLKEVLNDPKYADLKTLFPQTCQTLQVIAIYNYAAYLQVLKESFEIDMKNLYGSIYLVIESHEAELEEKNPEVYNYFMLTYKIVLELETGMHPGDVMNNMVISNFYNRKIDDNLKVMLKAANMLSQSLRSKSSGRYWAPNDTLALLSDPLTLKLYLGLLYHKNSDPEIREKFFRPIINILQHENQIKKVYEFLQGFITKIYIVNNYIEVIKDKTPDQINYQDYYNVYNSSIEMIGHLKNINDLDLDGLKLDLKIFNRFTSSTKTLGNIYLDVNQRNYSSAIVNSVVLFDSIMVFINFKYLDKLMTYGSFIAAVAQAKTSDEVENALEAIVLPSGSSSIKRETDFNVALNSYVGPFLGDEVIPALNKDRKHAFSTGLTVPVGVAVSWGKHCIPDKSKDGGASHSIFFSLIDLGALTAFRFSDSTSSTFTNILLKDIIAPGIFYYYGFSKSPFSVGLGVQAGPQLRSINAKSVDISDNIYWRVHVSFVVDIPLLNFYTVKNEN